MQHDIEQEVRKKRNENSMLNSYEGKIASKVSNPNILLQREGVMY